MYHASRHALHHAHIETQLKTGSATSMPTGLTCGVPQGSVLRPILLTIYTAVELGKIIRKYGLEYHVWSSKSAYCVSHVVTKST